MSFSTDDGAAAPRVWPVGALCRAAADALDARFNPVAVRGEVTGFSRAASGHCYFSLKDAVGQLRCAMFRRAAGLLDFPPRDGELVEVRGRLGVYEARGDLQLVVESMTRAGQGALFEQFLRLKARLEAEGLFDAVHKRALPVLPRGIGVVTSPQAAALHDVATALARRVPHIPVVIAPASVQGAGAPAELVRALGALGAVAAGRGPAGAPPIDLVLLVRGGGSIEDLWAFNDEQVARAIRTCPVPVVAGVGHETDFTIADFAADLRAPTPTAAAELAAQPRGVWLGALDQLGDQLQGAVREVLDRQAQRLDLAASRLGRPSARAAQQQLRLARAAQRLRHAVHLRMERLRQPGAEAARALPRAMQQRSDRAGDRLSRVELRLRLLDPKLVLERGYAWLADEHGVPVTRAAQTHAGQALRATLADGVVDVRVSPDNGR
ncbi:exodeoxyribonuclease VII large subunit [Xylophilus sp.]|uniref:exodeoxyribonuclease VII large subunit n=1 Tax=Xylophilus sp. TaxID=2653893 RepID=UPI0013BC5FD7|nr:exodeoxyribonuclease VII large subunit [Xylophilus sp.]KAF1044932.1 MAG: Exodeoxyribonuclease 7 large subunit [Xylophilus sp.]